MGPGGLYLEYEGLAVHMYLNAHSNRNPMILDQANRTQFFPFNYKKSSGRFPYIVDRLKDRVVMPTMRVPFIRETKEAGESSIWLIL